MALVQNSSGEKQQNWDFPGGPEIKNLPCGDRKEGRREREGHSERQRKKKGGRQGKRERDGGGGRKEERDEAERKGGKDRVRERRGERGRKEGPERERRWEGESQDTEGERARQDTREGEMQKNPASGAGTRVQFLVEELRSACLGAAKPTDHSSRVPVPQGETPHVAGETPRATA